MLRTPGVLRGVAGAALALLAGCAPPPPPPFDATAVIDGDDPLRNARFGRVSLAIGPGVDGGASSSIAARFYEQTRLPARPWCDERAAGECLRVLCRAPPSGERIIQEAPGAQPIGAGQLRVSGFAPLAAQEGSSYFAAQAGVVWPPGERVEVAASGEVFPAFDASVAFPHAITEVTLPPADAGALARTAPLVARWTPVASSVWLTVSQSRFGGVDAFDVSVQCEFDGARGEGAVPAELLGAFMPGPPASINVGSRARTTVTLAGRARVELFATHWARYRGVTFR